MEVWRDIKGYEGQYQVSNLGRVRSLDRVVNNKHIKGQLITQHNKQNTTYKRVKLYKHSKRDTYSVHRLVAEAFIPNPNNYPEINHKDCKPDNNKVSNLEWCTREYNYNYDDRVKKGSISNMKAIGIRDVKTNVVLEFESFTDCNEFLTGNRSNTSIVNEMIKDNSVYNSYEIYFYIQRTKKPKYTDREYRVACYYLNHSREETEDKYRIYKPNEINKIFKKVFNMSRPKYKNKIKN